MKIMWSLLALALMAASTLVVSASTEGDTVWGEQERPVPPSTEEDFAAEKTEQDQIPVDEDPLEDPLVDDTD